MKPILCCIEFFPGFYESWLSQALDHEEESWLEYQKEDSEAPFHSVPSDKLAHAVYMAASYGLAYQHIARDWVEALRDKIRESIPKFNCRLESMRSPKEYNFSTDRIFVYLPNKLVTRWHEAMRGNKTFAGIVRERFTSRDGFISFYSPDLATWYEKPLSEWDHNEIGALLDAVLKVAGFDESELQESIYESLHESNAFSDAFDCCFTYSDVEKQLAA